MAGFTINHISKTYYDANDQAFSAISDVSFDWNENENIALVGESGSGKSTIARLIVGIEKPTSGKILFDGSDITDWNQSTWCENRKRIQAVFQDASGTLNPAHSVYHNVEEALRNLTALNKAKRHERIENLMESTHMDEKLLKVPVRQLSGGEQRRLSLLRALSIRPQYLVLDEVTSGLDQISANAVLNLLETYHEEYGCAYLLITHDRQIACRLSHRILEIQNGKFVRQGLRA